MASFRGSITRPWHSLSTLRPFRYLRGRKTRFRLLAKLYRTDSESAGFLRMVSELSYMLILLPRAS